MKKVYLVWGAALLSLALLTGCSPKEEAPEVEVDPGVAVEVQAVALGSMATENRITGTLQSGKAESVYVALSARVSSVSVEQGNSIKKGDVICTLDLSSFHNNYELAQMNYNSAQQSYTDQSALLDQQIIQYEKNYNDTLALFNIGAASQLEVDSARLTLDGARVSRTATLSQLEMAMKNAEATMEQITDSLKNVDSGGTVRATVSGTIVNLSVGRDSFVSPGMPVAVIDAISDMKVMVDVSENLVSKLQVGDLADVTVSAASRTFQGAIKDIATSANPATRLYSVEIAIPEASAEGLFGGMFADVILYTNNRESTIVVPTEAVMVDVEGDYVMVLDHQNGAHRRSVEVGLVGTGVTEILSGLSVGDTLVTVGQSFLSEGDLARVVPGEAKAP